MSCMKTFAFSAALLSATLIAVPSGAQTPLGGFAPEEGLHWHVAAPQGASWSLTCRFRPLRVGSTMTNSLTRTGSGPMPGRLPGQDGRCTLTKTGGNGPVGIALVKNGQPTAAGTVDPAKPAAINVF